MRRRGSSAVEPAIFKEGDEGVNTSSDDEHNIGPTGQAEIRFKAGPIIEATARVSGDSGERQVLLVGAVAVGLMGLAGLIVLAMAGCGAWGVGAAAFAVILAGLFLLSARRPAGGEPIRPENSDTG